MRHAAHGKTNAQIGVKLSISEETVKSHVQHGTHNRAHAVAIITMNAPELMC